MSNRNRIGVLDRIEEEHEAKKRPIDGRGSIALGEQMVSIGFRVR